MVKHVTMIASNIDSVLIITNIEVLKQQQRFNQAMAYDKSVVII